MFKLTPVLLLVTFSAHLSLQQVQLTQPLCGTEGTLAHVPDPSSCHGYLYCQWNETIPTQLIAVHQVDCRNQGSMYFLPDPPSCVTDIGTCNAPSSFCPTASLMVANPADPTCKQYRACTLPGMNWITCPGDLVFNRNTGSCDHVRNAPCADPIITPECPPLETGFFPGANCWSYIFCFEGTEIDQGECAEGWWFNEAINECAEGDNGGQCVRPAFDFIPPKVSNGVFRRQKKEITIKIEGLDMY
ncbi:hypothetical protein ACKWTF_015734 [Chironomus riparius]